MIRTVREKIIHSLWEKYRQDTPQIQPIQHALKNKGINQLYLDHFAIIDLPSERSGIPVLSQLFKLLGFVERGEGYLADKQNDFCWLAEVDCMTLAPQKALPQVVVADFRLDEMPVRIQRIIKKYTAFAQQLPLLRLQALIKDAINHDQVAFAHLQKIILGYLAGRDWPAPTLAEFSEVRAFNELLAWVLVFGRRPNHFTLSVHLLDYFRDLSQFQAFIENEAKLPLNQEGGTIKGGENAGIAQGSTIGSRQIAQLADEQVCIPTGFVEFVWRYPVNATNKPPLTWQDYYTGFIPQHADHVIESLYDQK